MVNKSNFLIAALVGAATLTGCPPEEPTPEPTDVPTPTESPTPTLTATLTPTATPSPSPPPTAEPTPTEIPTPTPCVDGDGDGVCAEDDCDDGNADQGEAVPERCGDLLDNDCDGETDEVGAGPYFLDSDGDGYGDTETSADVCNEGYVTEGGDCDDTAPGVSPGSDEVWENDVDEDCDGEAPTANIYVYKNIADVPEGVEETRIRQTITEAITLAFTGQTIAVAPGTYRESLDFIGKDLQLVSMMGPEETIIDASGEGSAIKLVRGEGQDALCRIEGFTLQGGSGTASSEGCGPTPGFAYGGGICAEEASAHIIGNIITGNDVNGSGGGLYLKGGEFFVYDNVVMGNEAGFDAGGMNLSAVTGEVKGNSVYQNQSFRTGGGMVIIDTDIAVRDNLVAGNRVEGATTPPNGGGMFVSTGAPTLENNVIYGNYAEQFGGGVSLADTEVGTRFANNIISGNIADNGGGGVVIANLEDGGSSFINNTIVGNNGEEGGGIYIITGNPVLSSNIVAFNQGEGANVFAEPSSILSFTSAYNVYYSPGGAADVNDVNLGPEDITGDPMFTDDPLDFDVTDDVYTLKEGSVAIDAGDPAEASNDVNGTRNDAGAYGGPLGASFSFTVAEGAALVP